MDEPRMAKFTREKTGNQTAWRELEELPYATEENNGKANQASS